MSMNYIIIIVRVVGSEEVDCRNFENTITVQVIYWDNTKNKVLKLFQVLGIINFTIFVGVMLNAIFQMFQINLLPLPFT